MSNPEVLSGISLVVQTDVLSNAEQGFYEALRTSSFPKEIKNKFIENYLSLKSGQPGAHTEKQFISRFGRNFVSQWKQECENGRQSVMLPVQLTMQSPLLLTCWAPVLPWRMA